MYSVLIVALAAINLQPNFCINISDGILNIKLNNFVEHVSVRVSYEHPELD